MPPWEGKGIGYREMNGNNPREKKNEGRVKHRGDVQGITLAW